MLEKIEALRKKPKQVKERYAFWSALSATLIIALLWATTIPSRFEQMPEVEQAQEASASASLREIGNSIMNRVEQTFSEVQSQTAPADDQTEDDVNTLDLQALVASSSQSQTGVTASSSASTTATTTSAASAGSTTPAGS